MTVMNALKLHINIITARYSYSLRITLFTNVSVNENMYTCF